MSDIVKEAWRKYLIQMKAHPLRTKAITAGVLAGCNDAMSQKIVGVKKLQFRRLLLIMLFGFAYGAPFGHYFHKLLDYFFKGKNDSKTVAKKVVVEQLTASPLNNIAFLMYYGVVIEGRPFKLVTSRVRKDYLSIQLAAWKVWPLVCWVSHQYVPMQYRVLFGTLVGSCWSIFMNLKARSAVIKQA